MTRARKILSKVNEILPATVAVGAGLGIANLAHQAYQAKKRREEKIRAGGYGHSYDTAKSRLHKARRKGIFSVGKKRQARRAAISQAKQNIKTAANKGLSKYARRLGNATGEQGKELRKKEMTEP